MTDKNKFKNIDDLTNCIQKVFARETKEEIAYLIHQIINDDLTEKQIIDAVTSYKIMANRKIFMSV